MNDVFATARKAPRAASPGCVDCGASWTHQNIPCGPLETPRCADCQARVYAAARATVLPVRQGGSPALPLPKLEDGTSDETIVPERASEPHDDCARVLDEAPAPEQDLEAALRASLKAPAGAPVPGWVTKATAARAASRDLTAATVVDRPRPAFYDGLDAHERALVARKLGRRATAGGAS